MALTELAMPPRREQREQGSESTEDTLETFENELAQQRSDVPRGIWMLIQMLGKQIAHVRHDLRNVEQHEEIRDYRLFGFDPEDEKNGGRIGRLERNMVRVERKLDEHAITQNEKIAEVRRKQDGIVQEVRASINVMMWRFIGILCALIVTLLSVLFATGKL